MSDENTVTIELTIEQLGIVLALLTKPVHTPPQGMPTHDILELMNAFEAMVTVFTAEDVFGETLDDMKKRAENG